MGSIAEKIRDEVRHMPFGDRLRLVRELEHDLDSDEKTAGPEIEQAWDEQEQQRVNEVISGEVKLMTLDDLTSRLDEVRGNHTA